MINLPEPIVRFYQMANNADENNFKSIFTHDAIVFDEGKEMLGLESIEKWSKDSIFNPKIHFKTLSYKKRDRFIVVTSEVDGSFDKTGLPNPFLLDIHFSVVEEKIKELICTDFNSI
ncbi:hypothetical protein [Peribacillus simplex]|uniref:hypothetical protein n=1 Tax=Peribacillus simplex TaxID=1478 RepID=UPI0024C1BBB9|nr:hypothetical protein [Peribacillus simplex]WHY58562.1 hypothetical protein QNH43_10030 [Peribacillus simplex]